MDIQKFAYEYRKHNPDGHFFDKSKMSFYGESIEEMEVVSLSGRGKIIDSECNERQVWCVKSISHKNVEYGCNVHYTYFDKETFEEVEPRWRNMIWL